MLELYAEYLGEGRIRVDPARNPEPVTLQDPCNVARKGGLIEAPRYVLNRVVKKFIEMWPLGDQNFCCGGGGGLLVSDYRREREDIGRIKAEQIRATGAKIVAAPCHNCRDQIENLSKKYKLGVDSVHFWDLIAKALVYP